MVVLAVRVRSQGLTSSYAGAGRKALDLVERIEQTYFYRQGRVVLKQVLSELVMQPGQRLPPWLVRICVDYLPEVNSPLDPDRSLIDIDNELRRQQKAEEDRKRKEERKRAKDEWKRDRNRDRGDAKSNVGSMKTKGGAGTAGGKKKHE